MQTTRHTVSGRFHPQFSDQVPWGGWTDHPGNPVVSPYYGTVVADPSVVTPDISPDGAWHMFICATWDTMLHLKSGDGVAWEPVQEYDWTGFSPFVHKEKDGTFYLYYQRQRRLQNRCCIVCRHSTDLNRWSERHEILEPDLPWEDQELRPTTRNACLVKVKGKYRLYYSGGLKIIPDLGFEEPACIGVAHADHPLGPWVKRPEPILSPDPEDPWRNIGAGAMKVVYRADLDLFFGFNNGIFWRDGHSHSAIHVLVSKDGYDWYDTPGNPILSPEPGWKQSLVYQLCLAPDGDALRLYYNCREGWRDGVERIGMATGRDMAGSRRRPLAGAPGKGK